MLLTGSIQFGVLVDVLVVHILHKVNLFEVKLTCSTENANRHCQLVHTALYIVVSHEAKKIYPENPFSIAKESSVNTSTIFL